MGQGGGTRVSWDHSAVIAASLSQQAPCTYPACLRDVKLLKEASANSSVYMSGSRDLSSPERPGGAEQGFWVLLLGRAKERMEK